MKTIVGELEPRDKRDQRLFMRLLAAILGWEGYGLDLELTERNGALYFRLVPVTHKGVWP